MFDDDFRPSPKPAADLLDELESIKGVLTDEGADDSSADVPILDDMVINNLGNNAKLLNIAQIFEESAVDEEVPAIIDRSTLQFPRFTLDVAISDETETLVETPHIAVASAPPRVRPDYSREILIQDLVDEFIPQIEAELHRRLAQLDDIVLRRLKDST